MAFTRAWQESYPDDDNYGFELDDYQKQIRVDVRERLGVQHKTYANETGHTDVGEHKPGECNIAFIGAKASFPMPASSNAGCLAVATDEKNQLYYWSGSAWSKVQEPMLITGDQTIAGNKTFASIKVSQNQDIGNFNLRAKTVESDVPTGTAPLTVASTTAVTNLNADTVDGKHADAFFGAWESKSFGTIYQAASDGEIVGYVRRSSGTIAVAIKTDGNATPAAVRQKIETEYGNTAIPFNCPVRKGDYWTVERSGTIADEALAWLPRGA